MSRTGAIEAPPMSRLDTLVMELDILLVAAKLRGELHEETYDAAKALLEAITAEQ